MPSQRIITASILTLAFVSVSLLAACGDSDGGAPIETRESEPDASRESCRFCASTHLNCDDFQTQIPADYIRACDELGESRTCLFLDVLVECDPEPCADSTFIVDGPYDDGLTDCSEFI